MKILSKSDILTRFGNRLRSIRKSKNLSQEALAHLSGLDRTYLSGVERGQRNISLNNIEVIAEALEIPLGELFYEL